MVWGAQKVYEDRKRPKGYAHRLRHTWPVLLMHLCTCTVG